MHLFAWWTRQGWSWLVGGSSVCCSDVREIGNVDEGVIERGENACDAEDKLACVGEGIVSLVPGL